MSPKFPRRGEWLLSSLLLLAVVAAFLAPGLSAGGMVFGWDAVGEHFHWESWVWDRYREGRSALWNSHVSCGFPFPGQGTTAVFYPLNFPHLFMAHGQAMDVVLVLHLVGLGLGTYVFTRGLGCVRSASFVAAASAMLCGPTMGAVFLGGRAQIYALTWIPWSFVAIERGLARRTVSSFVPGAAVVALSILAGQPYTTVQTLLSAFAYGFVRAALPIARSWRRAGHDASDGVARSNPVDLASLTRPAMGGAAMIGLGLLLAAPQWVSWIEYRPLAGAGGGALPPGLTRLGALPPRQWLALLFPGFFGDEATGIYWGHFLQSFMNPYVGWLPLVFLPEALRRVPRGASMGLTTVAASSVLLAMGEHAPWVDRLWRWVPGTEPLHFASRWLAITGFAASALAALGMDEWLRTMKAGERSRARVTPELVLGLLLLLASVVLCSLWIHGEGATPQWWREILDGAQRDPFRSIAGQSSTAAELVAIALSQSQRAVAASMVVGGAIAVALAMGPIFPRRAAASLLVVVALADLAAWSRRFVFHAAPAPLAFDSAAVKALTCGDGPCRYATTLSPLTTPGPPRVVGHYAGIDNYGQTWMHRGMVSGLDSMQWGSYGLASIDRLALGDGEIFAQAFPKDRRILDLLNVRWVLAPRVATLPVANEVWRVAPNTVGFERLVETGVRTADWSLFRNPDALPRAFVAYRARRVPAPVRLDRALEDVSFDPARVVLLADVPDPEPLMLGPEPERAATIEWLSRDDGEIELRVDTAAPGLLVVSESHYPGWQATIDGRPSRLLEADGALLAVPVRAGLHVVGLWYRPTSIRWALVAALGTASTLMLIGVLRPNGKGTGPPDSKP